MWPDTTLTRRNIQGKQCRSYRSVPDNTRQLIKQSLFLREPLSQHLLSPRRYKDTVERIPLFSYLCPSGRCLRSIYYLRVIFLSYVMHCSSLISTVFILTDHIVEYV